MELKPNMYVRTKRDGIGKIISLSIGEEDECCFIELSKRRTGIKEHNIVKEPSHNIIDLIEVGDYVNGKKVIRKWEEPFGEFVGQIFIKLEGEETIPTIRKIETIVTKEQMEAIQYKVV